MVDIVTLHDRYFAGLHTNGYLQPNDPRYRYHICRFALIYRICMFGMIHQGLDLPNQGLESLYITTIARKG